MDIRCVVTGQNESGRTCFPWNPRPFKILIEYLEGGDILDQFLEQYPTPSPTND